MKIFVIHARRTGYGVVRALCRETRDIYAADVNRTAVAHSRYIKKFYCIPDITKTDEKEFLAVLIDLAKKMRYREEKPLVFTGKDDYLMFFAKHSSVLKEYYDYSFESDSNILEKALNKVYLAELCQQINIPVPRFRVEGDPDLTVLDYPVVIKPAVKNQPEIDVVARAFRLRMCKNENELAAAVDMLRRIDQDFIVQEFIPGGDSNLHTLGVFSYGGELVAWSTSKKIRQFPPGTGECSFGTTTHMEELVPFGEKLLRALCITGISQIEFKEHAGRYYLMEINPRVWSWHHIHSKVGVNLTKIAHQCAVLGDIPERVISPKKKHATWQFFMMDLLHNRLLNKNVSYGTLLRDALTVDIEAFWNWSDPLPFLVHAKQTVKYICQQLAEKNPLA